jgi:hypothetical protein
MYMEFGGKFLDSLRIKTQVVKWLWSESVGSGVRVLALE